MSFLEVYKHGLHFKDAINRWDEALPLGSGLMGSLVWGDGAPLRISLDRGDLWDTRPIPQTQEKDFTYEELISLIKSGRHEECSQRFHCFSESVTPTKIPAGRLYVDFGSIADRVESRLSLAHAEANVTLSHGEIDSTVSTFVHANNKYGFLRIEGLTPEIKLNPHDFTPINEIREGINSLNTASLHLLGYPPVEYITKGKVQIALQHTATDLSFALMTAYCKRDDATEAIYYVACSNDGENWLDDAALMLENALERGYKEDIKDHILWWNEFWSKSSINIPDKLIEKNWYLTNYFLGSCSRKGCPPMPLQGVWTADEGKLPPWRGDYHGDLNTQFSYYSFLKSDHLAEGESFIDFICGLNDKSREFAKSFYNVDGACLPSTYSIDGKPIGGWSQYSYSFTNHIWELHILYLYYKYTLDDTFLKEQLYPLLTGVEAVVDKYLIMDVNGCFTIPLTSSPEIHDDKPSAWLGGNISNYDLSLLRFLYEALMELSPIVCKEDFSKWEEKYSHLPQPAVDCEKGFKICQAENLEETHRHFSHLMAIHPLNQCRYTRSINEKKTIDDSVSHLEKLGRKLWVGFSFGWMAHLYAKQFNGEKAVEQLRDFFMHICSPNGFHLNGDFRQVGLTYFDYRPFTLESNMNAADAIQEMLMQCYDGVIRVFPAVPDEWKAVGCEFEGFLSFGGVKVSSAIKDGEVSYIKLSPKKDIECKIYNPFNVDTVVLSCGDEQQQTVVNEIICIYLEKNKEYTIIPNK